MSLSKYLCFCSNRLDGRGGGAKGGYNERVELNRRTEEKGWGEDSERDDKNSTTEIKTSERKKKKAEALKEMERKGT